MSVVLSGSLSEIYSNILSGILFGIKSDIQSDIPSGILSGIYFDILSGILFGIYSDILSEILSGSLSEYIPTFCLAFFSAFSLAWFRVQAHFKPFFPLLKSRDPHLAGGEQKQWTAVSTWPMLGTANQVVGVWWLSIHIYIYMYTHVYMRRCQSTLSLLSSRNKRYRFWGSLSLSAIHGFEKIKEWKRKRKGKWQGKAKERERKRNRKRKRKGEGEGKGKEQESQRQRKRKRKGEGKGKKKGKGKEKEKEKEKQRTRKESICGQGLLFEQMGIAKVSLGVYISNFASCMYATWCKTTWDMDIMHNYRYHFVWGPYRYTVFGALSRHKRTVLYKSSIPELWPYLNIYIYYKSDICIHDPICGKTIKYQTNRSGLTASMRRFSSLFCSFFLSVSASRLSKAASFFFRLDRIFLATVSNALFFASRSWWEWGLGIPSRHLRNL